MERCYRWGLPVRVREGDEPAGLLVPDVVPSARRSGGRPASLAFIIPSHRGQKVTAHLGGWRVRRVANGEQVPHTKCRIVVVRFEDGLDDG